MSGPPDRPDEADLVEWIRHVATALPRDNFELPAEHAEDFLLLYGICLQSARFADAYMTLRGTNHEHEGQVLARSAFEHAVTAHWAFFTKNGTKRLGVAVNRGFDDYFSSMSSYLDSDEIRDTLAKRPVVDGTSVPKFTEMMWELDSGSFLKTSYRTLSLAAHPTHATVLKYIESVDGKTHLRHDPRDGSEYPVLYATAISAMLALSLIEYMVDPLEARVLLDEPSERLKLPILLNDAIPSERRREF